MPVMVANKKYISLLQMTGQRTTHKHEKHNCTQFTLLSKTFGHTIQL